MWQAMNKHPYTGILMWVYYCPDILNLPTLKLIDLARYDSWNNHVRLIKDGLPVNHVICWQKCEIPERPSQLEIDQKFI